MSIRQAMIRFATLMVGALVILAALTLYELRDIRTTADSTGEAVHLVREVTLLDMYHEGLEAATYRHLAAVLAQDQAGMEEVAAEADDVIRAMQQTYERLRALRLTDEEAELIQRVETPLKRYFEAARRQLRTTNEVAFQQGNDAFRSAFEDLESALEKAGETIVSDADARVQRTLASVSLASWVMTLGVLAVMVIAALNLLRLWRFLQAEIGGEPAEVAEIARQIRSGNLRLALDDQRPGLYGELRAMQQNLKTQFEEISRLRQALETVTTNVMVADDQFNIVYMNPAIKRMFEVAEAEIREVFPDFRADDLIGKNIDLFHKNPAHQRQLLSHLNGVHKARIAIGSRHFDLTAAPVIGPDGERLGSVVEWADITQQLKVEQEIQNLVEKAAAGKLDARIGLEDKEGFALNLSRGLNTILDQIQKVFDDVQRTAEALANGDLTVSLDTGYQGQYGTIARALNNAVDKLHHAIRAIVQSTRTIQQAMTEVATGNSQLSERTEKQSSNLEETASAMEELAANVRNTATNAREANELAVQTQSKAEQGGEIVRRTIASMQEINAASSRISDIIEVIDDIAFQTNLLALNASVEAARAGEHGRGFAVVATEVRNLAQRSATSAREIKELIEDSVRKVEAGGKLVNESGDALAEIIANVKKVTGYISDIAGATEEQSSGIEQVNRAVSELDEITQQNAALAEEVASASESAIESADAMAHQVAFFRVDGVEAVTAGAPRQVAAAPPHGVPGDKPGAATDQIVSPLKPGKTEDSEDEWEEF
ncbi:methyl-accepting chemotaxis protein [Hahella sp. SMD15-11]|uniref:Methyl-accepting chemotaxis protein n=1 Tax=Thermohahella caldifontis TaxID=3142973 RepID=A0AB39UT89_9GAMM